MANKTCIIDSVIFVGTAQLIKAPARVVERSIQELEPLRLAVNPVLMTRGQRSGQILTVAQ